MPRTDYRPQRPPTRLTMTDPGPLPSADTVADGVRLAELIEQLPVSRGSVFELVKALGVTTAKGPRPGRLAQC